MKRVLLWVLLLLLMGAVCAHCEEAFLYGAWSEWSETAPVQTNSIEIEKKSEITEEEKTQYSYKRYVYYDKRYEAWFSTYTEDIEEGIAEDDFGYWEETVSSQPLPVLYDTEPLVIFEGGWYHEVQGTERVVEQKTLYRYRSIKKSGCVFSVHEHVINVNEYRPLTLVWKEKKQSVTFESSDTAVAEIDGNGKLHGTGKGECVISVLIDGKVADTCRVETCKKGYVVEDGMYVLTLCDGSLAIGSGDNSPSVGDHAKLAASIHRNTNRVRVENTDTDAFLLRIAYSEELAYCWNEDGGISLQYAETEEKSKEYPINFQWKAMQCADGTFRLYAKGAPDTVLTFSGMTINCTASLADAAINASTQKFIMTEKVEYASGMSPVMPVDRNGTSYVTSEYGVQRTISHMHEGLDIGSYGKRVPCYSILPGTVTRIRTACKHDYDKHTKRNGRYFDPCGNTAGNYVIVDHGNGLSSAYMHLSRVDVKVGDTVYAGQQLGITGSTGSSSAVHLHFAIMVDGTYIDPRDFMDFPGTNVPIE